MIVAQKGRSVRIKFTNKLNPTGAGGELFLPVDTTVMGAGMGPTGAMYTENRATIHLHGGVVPWISDGTQHQWVVPASDNTSYQKGDSVGYVPDMWFDSAGNTIAQCAEKTTCGVAGARNNPGAGSLTFYYPNAQSARLMFYHDHAYGITRLNVYAGEAAGYLLTDNTEQALVASGIVPPDQIPLIIQDKTFVDASAAVTANGSAVIRATDPTWPFFTESQRSNLWLPHVYMPNQNTAMLQNSPYGRWDYGPWFWPPWPISAPEPVNPYCAGYDSATKVCTLSPWQPPNLPAVPPLSTFMEAFMDTPVVNGTAYPVLNVDPKAYRFRILNGANDRFWNLQLYVADPSRPTEVKMVLANGTVAFPAGWPKPDLRDGGVPDPSTRGPNIIQIGNEGGFLPAPVVWPNIPIGWDKNPKSMTFGNVQEHNLFLGPAERADVIIDFAAFQGQTLILYNDAPTAVPALDSRYDYYTGNGDQTDTGGAPSTQIGYGPNTRTIMQINVAGGHDAPDFCGARSQCTIDSLCQHAGKRSEAGEFDLR